MARITITPGSHEGWVTIDRHENITWHDTINEAVEACDPEAGIHVYWAEFTLTPQRLARGVAATG